MANIAVVFHWTPDTMDKMAISELMQWQHEAKIRSESENE